MEWQDWDIDWTWAQARPELGRREALLDLKAKGQKYLDEHPDPWDTPKLTWWQAFVQGFSMLFLGPPEREPPPTAQELVERSKLRVQRAWAQAMVQVCTELLEEDNG